MARNEQKLTLLQSPLSAWSLSGDAQSTNTPRTSCAADTSRYSPARFAYSQRRETKSRILLTPAGVRRHDLRSQNVARDGADTVLWVEGDRPKVGIAAQLTGPVKMTTEGDVSIFTAESGASIRVYANGIRVYAPAPLRSDRAREQQADTPWYQRTVEAVGRAGIRIENIPVSLLMRLPGHTQSAACRSCVFRSHLLKSPK